MTDREKQALAAEYVLGTLDQEDRTSVTQALESDPALQGLVAQWEQRLGLLAEAVEPVAPPASLWSAIDAALPDVDQEIAGTRTIRADQGDWRPLADGVVMKSLFIDHDAGWHSFLLRLAPGAQLSGHGHKQPEECYVISGDMQIGPMRLTVGDYHLAEAGTEHPAISSSGGALIFVRAEIGEIAA